MRKWQALGLVSLLVMVAGIATGVYEMMEERWGPGFVNFGAAFAFYAVATWALRKHEAEVLRRRRLKVKWWGE